MRFVDGFVKDADHPLRHGGPLLETNGAAIGETTPSERFLRLNNAVLDPTLFEASLPLLKATNNSLIRTATDAIDLSAARLTIVGDLIQLNASQFDVVSGALANVTERKPPGGRGESGHPAQRVDAHPLERPGAERVGTPEWTSRAR